MDECGRPDKVGKPPGIGLEDRYRPRFQYAAREDATNEGTEYASSPTRGIDKVTDLRKNMHLGNIWCCTVVEDPV
ncbi:hypothetical protein CC1G_14177 [Coprinopsis cinerea okayama7|uniref:Uncharacterized protein n=1 Tax=Coprinopsis cinerea (strain Okayama-7 / 130 / ATCC MYA-4618 / FGSC 9003) TaxID=240176 RepID=D6RL78_COPC7|nr:hypothetical protein CC1G_14177 [Coprinopsis cinerea okayama7\|eukprot:XP_002911644.1 hypothetical protein CC1G_14177 [Coprinopsis cinerea okayama7\